MILSYNVVESSWTQRKISEPRNYIFLRQTLRQKWKSLPSMMQWQQEDFHELKKRNVYMNNRINHNLFFKV